MKKGNKDLTDHPLTSSIWGAKQMTIYHQKGSFIVGCGCLGFLTAMIVFSLWMLI